VFSFVNKINLKLGNFHLIFLLIYSLLGIFILIGLIIHFKKEKKESKLNTNKFDLNELTVLVPFRNEKYNLTQLIDSIQKQSQFPSQFIFIDDHSTDDGKDEIQKLNNSIPCQLISLPIDQQGKKSAIRKGIQLVNTKYILTLDADVVFSSNYFKSLQDIEEVDMVILPVIMKGEGSIERFFELDFSLSNAINTSISTFNRPFIACGANLLFKKDSFLQFDSYENHKKTASGDDVFLLRDFQKSNCLIKIETRKTTAVYTKAPSSIMAFLYQRLRWISKGGEVNDYLSNLIVVLAGLSHFAFMIGFILIVQEKKWLQLFEFILIKSLIEIIIFYLYFKNIGRLKTLLLLPFSTIVYPIYILTLLILSYFIQIKWKDRVV